MVVNTIASCNADIEMNEIQPRINYSKIYSAGLNNPLSADSNVESFVDITLLDVVQVTSGESSVIALTKQGIVFGRKE